MAAALRIPAAARELGRSRRTLERWLRRGCPHTRQGRTVLFDVEAVRAWHDGEPLSALARAVVWALDGDAGHGRPAWRELALPEDGAIALLLMMYDRAASELGAESGELPEPLRHRMSRLLCLRHHSLRR